MTTICLWKLIANSDKVKQEQGNQFLTLMGSKEVNCYSCNGYRRDCVTYEPVNNKPNPKREEEERDENL